MTNNSELAIEIMNYYYLRNNIDDIDNKDVRKFYTKNKNKPKDEILEKAFKICGKPINPASRYFYATYFSNNKEKISYIRNYVENDLYEPIIKNEQKRRQHNDYLYTYEQAVKDHKANFYYEMMILEKKENMLDDALNDINIAIELSSYLIDFYEEKVKILLKMKKTNEAIEFLKDVKQHHDFCNTVIDLDMIKSTINENKERARAIFKIYRFNSTIEKLLAKISNK